MYLEKRFYELFPNGTLEQLKIFIAGATVSLHYIREVGLSSYTAMKRVANLKAEIATCVNPGLVN